MAFSVRVPAADNGARTTREMREKYYSYINADPALIESRRWIEKVTRKRFKSESFRESLADGILLCELIQVVAGVPLGRINRLPTAYAGIDNLNMFFKACEVLGLKKLHLFDVTDLQEVTPRRGDSTSSRAKETQRRLQNVAITILWLAKSAQKQGYQGPVLDSRCFHHLLPEVHYQRRKDRQPRKRQSLGDLENKKRNTENISLKKRDRVFDKVDIRDRKEKFKSLENEAKKEQVTLNSNRRKSTGGILKRLKDKNWDQEEGKTDHKVDKQAKFRLPEPKLHVKQELYIRRGNQTQMELAVLDSKRGRRGNAADRLTSPPPISLGRKVEVDLKEKQKKFEGLDHQAKQQSSALSGKNRPVSWAASENRPLLKKQNPVDVGFKEKHKNYEQLQRQATTESAVLEGKLRPQFDKTDGRPEKVAVATKADVKLREKQRDFEQRDYLAQKERAILEGNLRLSPAESKGKRPTSVVVPKREHIRLEEKKASFEQLDWKAEQDASILRGEHRQPLTEVDGRNRTTKVGLPRESNVGLLEKQRTFEAMDYQARKESEVLQKNKRKSFGSSVREPTPLSTSTRPQIAHFQSPSDRKADLSDVKRRNQEQRAPRPVSDYYDYSTFQNGYPESSKAYLISAASEDSVGQVFTEESHQSVRAPYEGETIKGVQNQRDLPEENGKRTSEGRVKDYSDYSRQHYDEPERRRSYGEEPMEIDVSDAKNLSYRDMVRAPRKKSRQTFIREADNLAAVEEMPWRKEVREVKDRRQLHPEEEQDTSYDARPSSPRSELGKAQYRDLVVPPAKKAVDGFGSENETTRKGEEMPWRKEVKDIKRTLSGEESSSHVQSAEWMRIRPSSLKTRDAFVTKQDEKHEIEMPWRKEVRELKARPRTEEGEDYRDENSPADADLSSAPDLRRLSYKEFIKAPVRKQRDMFQPEASDANDKEEMPWRKEVREFKRSTTEDEEEQVQKSSETLVQSAPERDHGEYAYHELVAKPPRKAKDTFVLYEAKTREEMPWRKEVREIKRTITEDEQVPRPSSANVPSSPDDLKDPLKFSYRDFVGKPRKKSDGFLASEKKQEQEMPWRKEVRELKARPLDEPISQSSRLELESAPSDAFYGGAERPLPTASSEGRRDLSRTATYPNRGAQSLSYKDFICPSSKASEPPGQVQRRSTKVRDLTRKFAEIEADKDRPKPSGPPSRKSLVDVAELQRIERDMKTRSWHGFRSTGYDSGDDFDDVRLRQRTRSQNEEEQKYRQQYQRENVSGLDEFDDVFQDPEGYFDQMKGPPPERKVEEEARNSNIAPSWEQPDERKEQVVTVRSTDDGYGQTSFYSAPRDNYHDTNPIRNEPSQHPKSSDDRIVVKQAWIQPNRVELAEASHHEPEDVKQEYEPRNNSQYVSQPRGSAGPFYKDYEDNKPYPPKRSEKRNEGISLQRSELDEDKCFIEQSEYPGENQSHHSERYGYREEDQVSKHRNYWIPRDMPSDTKDPRVKPTKIQAKNDGDMVFGGPIVVTGRRTQKAEISEVDPQRVAPSERENDRKGIRDGRKLVPDEDITHDATLTQDDPEVIKNAKNLAVQDISSLAKRDAAEPKRAHRPQVFGVFARNEKTQQRDDAHVDQSSEMFPKESEENLQETRRSHMLYLDENDQDWKTVQKTENNAWYVEERRQHVDEGYQNSVSTNTQLHPTVVSVVESRTQQWGSGTFDSSLQKDEQRSGRRRVMNFSDDYDDDVESGNKSDAFQITAQPVQEEERRRRQREEEKRREQLRDAEYREKYRKEFEEKNRKQRENSKYLMNLQMRAALEPDEDVAYNADIETQREVEQQEKQDFSGKSSESNDSDKQGFVNIVAAEEEYRHKNIEEEEERQNKDISPYERPRRKRSDELQAPPNAGLNLVNEENVIHREYRDSEQEARRRRLKAEEEMMALEAEEAALKQLTEAEEIVLVPTEKPPVEFSIDEEAIKKFLEDDNRVEDSYDENRNSYYPKTEKSGQRDVFYPEEDFPPKRELEMRGQKTEYPDNISKPLAEVLPMNGYHDERNGYVDAPYGVIKENGDLPAQSGIEPEVNGFDGYSIYETFIHGESNHVICMSCGTSIEKSPAMYIAELDCYWHVDCFSCVVCRAWFGDEYSPAFQITNSMLHCERCYITSEGERCTEV